MQPVHVAEANVVFKLPGGSSENDLPVEAARDEQGEHVLISTWEPDDDERAAIAAGANLQVLIWGTQHPPVALRLQETDVESDAPPGD